MNETSVGAGIDICGVLGYKERGVEGREEGEGGYEMP